MFVYVYREMFITQRCQSDRERIPIVKETVKVDASTCG